MIGYRRSRRVVTLAAAALVASGIISSPEARAQGVAAPAAWQKEVVYQIYPRSFADSDGDGVGDLRGITQKADYLQALGIDVVWLNPVYPSTHFDGGYDVTDYLGIDPTFGTLDDWYALRDALHARGIKIMMDLVLNHTSDGHPWFGQEKRLKTLQRSLTGIMKRCSKVDGERILDVLTDPEAAEGELTPHVTEAVNAVAAFNAQDATTAVTAGYPSVREQLTALAETLAPCAEHHEACPSLAAPFDDFYIWRETPNNWTSVFSGSVWHKVDAVGGYYMSLFSEHQVDLNWRNPHVRDAMARVVSTWESRGVDGMRLDSSGTLSKNPTFPDAPPSDHETEGRGGANFFSLPSVHHYLRELAHAYKPQLRSIGEVNFSRADAPLFYAGLNRGELKEVFVFNHMGVDLVGDKWHVKPFSPLALKRILVSQQHLIHGKAWLGNYFENHDQLRIVSRYGDDGAYRKQSAEAYATLLMTLEGTPYIYQGQEIGMTDLDPNAFQKVDDIDDVEARNFYHARVAAGADPRATFAQVATRNRDHVRSAMQWDASRYAGFSTAQPKINVNGNYRDINVQACLVAPDSVLHYYQNLIHLRRLHVSWITGDLVDELPEDPHVFAYSRSSLNEQSLVLLNLSGAAQDVKLPASARPNGAKEPLVANYPVSEALGDVVHLRPWEARVYVGGVTAGRPRAQ